MEQIDGDCIDWLLLHMLRLTELQAKKRVCDSRGGGLLLHTRGGRTCPPRPRNVRPRTVQLLDYNVTKGDGLFCPYISPCDFKNKGLETVEIPLSPP